MKKVKILLLTVIIGGSLLVGCGVGEMSVKMPNRDNMVNSNEPGDIDETQDTNNELTSSTENVTPLPKETTPSVEETTTLEPSPTPEPEKEKVEVIVGAMEPYFDNEKGEVALLDPYTDGTVVLQFEPSRFAVLYAEDSYAMMLDLQKGRTFIVKTVFDALYPERHAYRFWMDEHDVTGSDVEEEEVVTKEIAGCEMQTYRYYLYSAGNQHFSGVNARYIGYYTTLPDGTTLMTDMIYYSEGEDYIEREEALFKSITLYSIGKNTPQTPDVPVEEHTFSDENGNYLGLYYVYPEGRSVKSGWSSPDRYVVPDELGGGPVVRFIGNNYERKVVLGNIREIVNVDMTGSTMANFGTYASLQGVKRINLKPEHFSTTIIPEGIEYIVRGERSSSIEGYVSEMTFPTSLKEIEGQTFHLFTNIKKVTFLESEQQLVIGNSTFWGTSLSELELPNNVVFVGSYAFNTRVAWTKLSLSKNLKYIGSYAFQDVRGEHKDEIMVIPDGCIYVGEGAFSGYTVVVPDSVQMLGGGMRIITTAGSPAEAIAKERGYSYEIISEEEMAQYQSQYAD